MAEQEHQEPAEVSRPPEQARRRNRLIFGIILLLLVPICIILLVLLVPSIFGGDDPTPTPTPSPDTAPVANPGGPYIADEGQPLVFDGGASTGSNLTYAWDFGDGSTGTGVAPNYTYGDGPADLILTLTVTDDQGQTNSASTQVTVNNLPPVADPGGPYAGKLGEVIALSGTCSDPGLTDTCTIEWFGPDNAPLVDESFTCPDTAGDSTLSLVATDNDGATATATVVVTCGDTPPPTPTPEPEPEPEIQAIITVFLRSKNGLIFGFDGRQSIESPDGPIVTYKWDFGDGNVGEGIEIIHEYAEKGTYTVTLIVTDDAGNTAETSVVIP